MSPEYTAELIHDAADAANMLAHAVDALDLEVAAELLFQAAAYLEDYADLLEDESA